MRKAVKPIRDAFMEGAAQASKNAEAKKAKSAELYAARLVPHTQQARWR